MNFFESRVGSRVNGRADLEVEGLGGLSVPVLTPDLAPGGRICIAIRPEKLLMSSERPEGAVHAVEGRLDNVAYLGERSHFFVRLPGLDQPVAVSSQNYVGGWLGEADRGRRVWLNWTDEAMVLLDAE